MKHCPCYGRLDTRSMLPITINPELIGAKHVKDVSEGFQGNLE